MLEYYLLLNVIYAIKPYEYLCERVCVHLKPNLSGGKEIISFDLFHIQNFVCSALKLHIIRYNSMWLCSYHVIIEANLLSSDFSCLSFCNSIDGNFNSNFPPVIIAIQWSWKIIKNIRYRSSCFFFSGAALTSPL